MGRDKRDRDRERESTHRGPLHGCPSGAGQGPGAAWGLDAGLWGTVRSEGSGSAHGSSCRKEGRRPHLDPTGLQGRGNSYLPGHVFLITPSLGLSPLRSLQIIY